MRAAGLPEDLTTGAKWLPFLSSVPGIAGLWEHSEQGQKGLK